MTKKVLDSKLLDSLLKKYSDSKKVNPDLFSPRELDVLELIALGLSNKSISNQLGISIKTVEHHVSDLMRKIELPKGVNKRVWLAVSIRLTKEK